MPRASKSPLRGTVKGLDGKAWLPASPSGRVRTPSKSVSQSPKPATTKAKPVTFVSYLDKLQKDAQKSELDYTNTSPQFFFFLSLIQIPVALGVSYIIYYSSEPNVYLNRFSYMALGNYAAHLLGFGIACLINSAWHFDITEDIGYFINIYWSYTFIKGTPSPRQTLAHCMGLLWCVRICSFVGYRILKRGHDFRFDKLAMAKMYQLFGWTSGGTWCWANGFALWYVADAGQSVPLFGCATDYVGMFLFLFGITFELVADIQKYKFNAAFKAGMNKKWIATGLWARSRHPNYFGETTLWLGVALLCMSGQLTIFSVGVCLVTPIFSFVFLLFTSLMLLEKRADAKWGTVPEYLKYKATTPVWLPRIF